MKHAIIIIPTYNERENIQKVIPILHDIFAKIKTWQMSVLVVDDSSPDGTADVVRQLQKKYKFVNLFLNKKKAGLGGAYLKGMEHAFHKLDADVIFEFDADLSHDPKKIPDFLKQLDAGSDMVLGSRYMVGGGIPKDWGLHRKFLSVVGNWVIRIVLTDFRIHDWTGGYRAINRAVYEAVVPDLDPTEFSGYTFQIGFLHKTVRKGFKISEVPFHFIDRTVGYSKMGAEYFKNALLYIFTVRFQEIVGSRVFKFLAIGGSSALLQLVTLELWRKFLPYLGAYFAAVECSVLYNFILNNFWTFGDRKLKTSQYPAKFVQFNLASAGSIIIQLVIAAVGKATIGIVPLFTLPVLHKVIDTGTMYAVVGIFVGLFWNFFAYSKIVWKKKE